MTCILVNDASCLIDLRKGGLLPVLRNLPYRLVVPLPVRESELLQFTERDWGLLDDAGMITHELKPDEVGQVVAARNRYPALSANDCFCLITALVHSGTVLTGDAKLHKAATHYGLRVHGVLWNVDELESAAACPVAMLRAALVPWQRDPTVFLPESETVQRTARLETRR